MNGNAEHKTPNTAAPVTNVALKGERRSDVARVSRENMADRQTNSKSSDNTSNLSKQNQARTSREP